MRRERSQAKRTGRLLCLCAASLVACASPASHAAVHAQRRQPSPQQSQPSAQRRQEAERLVAEGVAALDRGERDAARESFRRALDSDPSNVTAHTYLGVIADQSGDLASAERHFAAAAIAAPLLPSARNNHGAVLLRLGRTNEAAKQFEVSLRLARNQPSALFNLAQIRFNSGTPEGFRAAFELFERANQLAPDAETARSLVATALQLNDRDAAARYFKQYASSLPGASGSVSEPAARAELGLALLENGLHEEAAAELGAAVAGDPAKPAWVVPLARAHLARNDIRAAGRALESSVARGAADATVYALLAEVYERSGHVENAIPAMRLAIARDPKNEAYQVRYGLLLTDTKAPAAAIIRLEEALKEFPRSARLWLALGIAQLNHGKNDDARASFARSLELDPQSVPALAYLGTTHAERGQYAEAVSFYERAIAADGRQAVPFYLAADTLLRQTEVDAPRAEKYLARAVEIDPAFSAARLALAKLYVRTERWAEAAEQFERVVRLEPDLAEAHYQLGRVYTRLKRAADAQRELATFKRLSDAQKEQKETERRDLVRRLANVRF